MKYFFALCLVFVTLLTAGSLHAIEYTLLEPIPGVGSVIDTEKRGASTYIEGIYNFAIYAVGIAALFMFTLGAFWYMTSAGNQSRVGTAKTMMVDALIGLLVALFAWLILNTINPGLTSNGLSALQATKGVARVTSAANITTVSTQDAAAGAAKPVPAGQSQALETIRIASKDEEEEARAVAEENRDTRTTTVGSDAGVAPTVIPSQGQSNGAAGGGAGIVTSTGTSSSSITLPSTSGSDPACIVDGEGNQTLNPDVLIADMANPNDAPLKGYSGQFGWESGTGAISQGAAPFSSSLASWMCDNPTYAAYCSSSVPFTQVLPWFFIGEGADNTTPASSVQVELRAMTISVLSKSTGQWQNLQVSNNFSGDYCPLGSNLAQCTSAGNTWINTDSGSKYNALEGLNMHGWTQKANLPDPYDIGSISVSMDARLVPRNSADLSNASYLLHTGADYYRADTQGKPNPGVGVSSLKRVTTSWQSFSMTTLTDVGRVDSRTPSASRGTLSAQGLRDNPPPAGNCAS